MEFNKRTTLIGLAFFSICAFWQLYDFSVPLILKDTFRMGDAASGWIMALDNMLALIMLPLFGRLSDKCKSRLGRRMPFIIFGTLCAVALLNALPAVIRAGSALREQSFLTGDNTLLTESLPRVRYAFIALLALLLVAMCTYRSPAVALMPDLTPKPQRSKANAIINLMGAAGGIIILVLTSVITVTRTVENGGSTLEIVDFTTLYRILSALMALAVFALFLTIKERKLAVNEETASEPGGKGKLSKDMLKSLILILLSVFFWFMGYNAVTTAFSKYYTSMWGDVSDAAMCLTIASAGAIVSYIPVGYISSRFGRKKIVLLGVAMLALLFAGAAFVKTFTPFVYVMFVLIGFAWAAINVNSYPMVVEISRSGDVGKYTGYYYSFSMAAQIITPIVSGFFLERVGYGTLFPYAAIMVAVSFVTMLLVKHGDSVPKKPESALESLNVED